MALLAAACAPAAPPSPTPTPTKPAAPPTAAPAKPADAAAAKPASTAAAAKTEAKPAASPAAKAEAKPAEAKPAASPATKAEAKPAPSPATKPALSKAEGAVFDEKAVADFYRGKTVRLVVASSAGGPIDLVARLVAKHMPRYVPGNPNIIVENRPGASGAVAANLVYNTEPKDGTVFITPVEGNVFQQAIGAPGIEFDATKFNWLGSTLKTVGACIVRTDAQAKSIQEAMAGKEVIMGVSSPGGTTHDIAATLKPVLGANFKLVPGYAAAAELHLAMERKETEGYCLSIHGILERAKHVLEGPSPEAKIFILMGAEPFDDPLTKGVPAAETLARSPEDRQMLRALNSVLQINKPYALPPGVPADRVAAMRVAMARTYADPTFVQEMQAAKQDLRPSTGEEVSRVVQELLNTPAPILARLKGYLFGT
jgi:tripartite-type tricarboxylate transporter receptor subunit TctC